MALCLILAAVTASTLAQGRPLTPRGLSVTVNFGFMRLARDQCAGLRGRVEERIRARLEWFAAE